MLLLSNFIVDLLTTVIPFPRFLYEFTINLNEPQIAYYPWCYLSSLLFPVLPTITNNISIWFVVVLTVQRFTCVWKRNMYDRIFSRPKIVILIGVITLTTTMFHSVLLIFNFRVPLRCPGKRLGCDFEICNEDPDTFIIRGGTDLETYIYSTYFLSRIVVFHIIPIVAIAVSNILLIRILIKAEGRRQRLFTPAVEKRLENSHTFDSSDTRKSSLNPKGQPRLSIARNANEGNQRRQISTTTHLLMVISTIYLVQHICQSILFVYGTALNVTGVAESQWLLSSVIVQNLIYWAGFPANFLLCISLQAPFRDNFISIYKGVPILGKICSSFGKIEATDRKSSQVSQIGNNAPQTLMISELPTFRVSEAKSDFYESCTETVNQNGSAESKPLLIGNHSDPQYNEEQKPDSSD